jgi:NAD-dependent deacetylase sirtuin 2
MTGWELPGRFFECAAADLPELDLLIVAGTSLGVHPAAGLVQVGARRRRRG